MATFIENLKEIYNTIPERLRTPPVISFIVIWIYMHWHLIFLYYNFDSGLTYEEKHSLLLKYINDNGGKTGMFWKPLFWTLISILIYFGVSIIIKGFSIVYSWVLAGMYYVIDRRKIRTAEEYSVINDRYMASQRRVEDLHERINGLNSALKHQESKNEELNGEKLKIIEEKNKLASDLSSLTSSYTSESSKRKEMEHIAADRLEKEINYKNIIAQCENQLKNQTNLLLEYGLEIQNDKIIRKGFSTINSTAQFFINFSSDMTLMIQEQPDTPFIKVNLKYEKNHIFQTENISFGYAYKFDNNPLPFGENRFRISYDFFKTSHNSERYNIEMLFYEGAFIGLSQQGLMIFLPKTFLQYLI